MFFSHSNKVVVGISSRSSQKDLQWLMDFIRGTFREVVSNVCYLPITNRNAVEWEAEVRSCKVGILYHTKHQGRLNVVDVDGALYNEELRSLCNILGKSKVLVVLDDLENCSDSERLRIFGAQPTLRDFSSQLLLFPEKDKHKEAYRRTDEFLKIFVNTPPPWVPQANIAKSKVAYNLSSRPDLSSIFSSDKSSKTSSHSKQKCQNLASKDLAKSKPPNESCLKISIFSRSAPTNYEWLMNWLKMNMIRSADIRAVHITNNSSKFHSEVLKCSFAILYHTRNQGRLNITDVTDSMYDGELKELSNCLGKKNVIVVIDDLQNTNTTEKERILESQPSIGRLAQDLYLFNEYWKNPENLENIKQIMRKMEKNEVMDTVTYYLSSGSSSAFPCDKSNKTSSHSKQNCQNLPSKDLAKSKPPNKSCLKISIFSRSAPTNYEWLMDWLKMNMIRSADIRAVHITNNSSKFHSEVLNCSFAILYHTRNQGRLNITDVTDSMYDGELKELSDYLGKERVIVVIDDLQTTNTTEKERILDSQASIARLAQDLYLFNGDSKNPENLENIKKIIESKLEKNEVLDTDYCQATPERKSGTSSKSAMNLSQDHYPDGVDCKSTSTSWSSSPKHSKEQDLCNAQGLAYSDPNDTGEPTSKRPLVDPSVLASHSSQAVHEVVNAFQDACSWFSTEKVHTANAKLLDYMKVIQSDYRAMGQEIQRLQRQNEDLQRTNSDLLKQRRDNEEANRKTIQEQQYNIEKKDEKIQVMEQKIQELQKKLREKEQLQMDEGQTQKEMQPTREKLQKDLCGRTIEENNERIQKLEVENQKLKKYIQEMEDKSRQEHPGLDGRNGMEKQESQRYKERSLIPGPEDDEMTPCEHRSSTRDMKHEDSHWDRTQRHPDAVCNQWQNPTEIQSLISANNLIKQQRRTIQEKDEEIHKLKSTLECNAKLIDEILTV